MRRENLDAKVYICISLLRRISHSAKNDIKNFVHFITEDNKMFSYFHVQFSFQYAYAHTASPFIFYDPPTTTTMTTSLSSP